jgi:hypothetical protein
MAPVFRVVEKHYKSLCRELRSTRHQTLLHGDAHFENFLFHDGSALGIDFGNAGWGNPMADMTYFLTKGIGGFFASVALNQTILFLPFLPILQHVTPPPPPHPHPLPPLSISFHLAHTENRRAWQDELMQTYHKTLTEGGKIDYSFEEMMEDFAFFTVSPLIAFQEHLKVRGPLLHAPVCHDFLSRCLRLHRFHFAASWEGPSQQD